jgi:hypothetical protein
VTWLRLIGAGLFVWVGLMAMVGIIGALGGFDGGHWLVGPAGALTFGMLIVAAISFFNPKGSNALGVGNAEEHLAELMRRDLIVESSFTATRVFGVEEYEDEGSHYFLELADGLGILALCGQYLYHYEPISDDPELNQPRSFPCTSFTVRRHRTEHYVIDLVCGGDVIEPEVMASGRVIERWLRDGFTPEDGTILTGIGFDELKRSRAGATG